MIGDNINAARAGVGFAIGSNPGVAIESANIRLIGSSITARNAEEAPYFHKFLAGFFKILPILVLLKKIQASLFNKIIFILYSCPLAIRFNVIINTFLESSSKLYFIFAFRFWCYNRQIYAHFVNFILPK